MSVEEIKFGFMPKRGTIDAVFILGRMQEEYHAKGKTVVYVFCGPSESFWQSTEESVGIGNEEEKISEVLVRLVMSLYEGAETRVRVDSEVKVRMHQGSVLLSFLFAVVVDAVTEFTREGAPNEFLYADDIVLMT